MPPQNRQERFIVFRSFLTQKEQHDLKEEALEVHLKSSSPSSFQSAIQTASIQLDLGIKCGASIERQIPHACHLARRAFAQAFAAFPQEESLRRLSLASSCPLTGIALLYGPMASMSPHCDSPTQPSQRNEWLAMMTIGMAVNFVCNDLTITMKSGDALVMDAMAVLHGVQSIVQDGCSLQLPMKGSRLGILLWQASQHEKCMLQQKDYNKVTDVEDDQLIGWHEMYQEDDDED